MRCVRFGMFLVAAGPLAGQQRSASATDNQGDFSLGRDLRDLFRTEGTNTFLVNVSYWIGG